jgi:membrane-associated protein
MIDDLLAELANQDSTLIGLLLLIVLAAEGSLLIGLFVPADAAILIAGAAVAAPAELAWVAVAGWLGCFAGATGGYLIGRLFGARARHGRAGRWIGDRRWARAEEIMAHTGGGMALALAYFLPGVHALTPVLAGALGLPYRRFIGYAMAGAAAWVTVYLLAGNMVGQAAREYQGLMIPLAAAAAGLMAGIALLIHRIGGRARHR